MNTKSENTETHQLSVAHNHSVILNHFCCFLCFSKKNHSSYGGIRGWLVGQSAAVHCLECKCVYSVEIVSHHSMILNHFCCFLSFSKKNHSSYGGVRVGWWVKVQLSIVLNVSMCIALRLSAKNTIRICSFSAGITMWCKGLVWVKVQLSIVSVCLGLQQSS